MVIFVLLALIFKPVVGAVAWSADVGDVPLPAHEVALKAFAISILSSRDVNKFRLVLFAQVSGN